jgi:cytochrome c biogenesis protein CcmG/thiol:disulfide interchange protein DsbE
MPRSGRVVGALLVLTALTAASCSTRSIPLAEVPALEQITPDGMRTLLAESDRPVVLNIWASWCVPCRSEAALLREAAAVGGDLVRFVGVVVKDGHDDARAFIAEFGLTGFEHYLDPNQQVSADLGGFGVPQTYFFAPGGELMYHHTGVIDERTLAVHLDDLIRLED